MGESVGDGENHGELRGVLGRDMEEVPGYRPVLAAELHQRRDVNSARICWQRRQRSQRRIADWHRGGANP